jgi:hypothetical protein
MFVSPIINTSILILHLGIFSMSFAHFDRAVILTIETVFYFAFLVI